MCIRDSTVTVRALKGLEDVVGLSIVDPLRDVQGWAFREAPGATGDPINGFEYLSEAYKLSLIHILRMSADSLQTIVPRALSQRTGTVTRPSKAGSATA